VWKKYANSIFKEVSPNHGCKGREGGAGGYGIVVTAQKR
jgi:hypothetical protein